MRAFTKCAKRAVSLLLAVLIMVPAMCLPTLAAEETSSTTLGNMIANNFDGLTDGQKKILKSFALVGDKEYTYTVPDAESNLISVNKDVKTVTAEPYTSDGYTWIPVSFNISVGDVGTAVNDANKNQTFVKSGDVYTGSYTYDGLAFSVDVTYELATQVADEAEADAILALLNAAGLLGKDIDYMQKLDADEVVLGSSALDVAGLLTDKEFLEQIVENDESLKGKSVIDLLVELKNGITFEIPAAVKEYDSEAEDIVFGFTGNSFRLVRNAVDSLSGQDPLNIVQFFDTYSELSYLEMLLFKAAELEAALDSNYEDITKVVNGLNSLMVDLESYLDEDAGLLAYYKDLLAGVVNGTNANIVAKKNDINGKIGEINGVLDDHEGLLGEKGLPTQLSTISADATLADLIAAVSETDDGEVNTLYEELVALHNGLTEAKTAAETARTEKLAKANTGLTELADTVNNYAKNEAKVEGWTDVSFTEIVLDNPETDADEFTNSVEAVRNELNGLNGDLGAARDKLRNAVVDQVETNAGKLNEVNTKLGEIDGLLAGKEALLTDAGVGEFQSSVKTISTPEDLNQTAEDLGVAIADVEAAYADVLMIQSHLNGIDRSNPYLESVVLPALGIADEEELNELIDKVNDAAAKLGELQTALEDADAALDAYSTTDAKLEEYQDELTAYTAGEGDLDTAKADVVEAANYLTQLDSAVSTLGEIKGTVEDVRDDLIDASSKVSSAQDMLTDAKAELSTKQEALEYLILVLEALVDAFEPVVDRFANNEWNVVEWDSEAWVNGGVLKDDLTGVIYAAITEYATDAKAYEGTVPVGKKLNMDETVVRYQMNMNTVSISVKLYTAGGEADSDELTLYNGKTWTTVETMVTDATEEEIRAAVDAYVASVKNEWGTAYEAAHYETEGYNPPASLTEDLEFVIEYTPVKYTVTATDIDDIESSEYYYGYKLTLPVHESAEKSYDYSVNGSYVAQGSVITITGDTIITRTVGKAYTPGDLYTIVGENYGNATTQAILSSGALLDNVAVNVRYPAATDAEAYVTLEGGILTANPYPSSYNGLDWVPYSYGAEGDEYLFVEGSTTANWSEQTVNVIYRLKLTNIGTDRVGEILDLAETLYEEAAAQKAALNGLAGYHSTMGQLDKTKLAALSAVIGVTDFTPDDGVESDEKNLELRAYFSGLVSNIVENNLDSNGYLKIYNMLGEYTTGGLSYYYKNSDAVLAEIESLSGYLDGLLADEEKETALGIMVTAAGFPEYVEKIENLQGAMSDVKSALTAPNAAIDVESAYLANLVAALNSSTAAGYDGNYSYAYRSSVALLGKIGGLGTVMVQVKLTEDGEPKVITRTYELVGKDDPQYTLSQNDVDDIVAAYNTAVDELLAYDAAHYTVSCEGTALESLVGLTLDGDNKAISTTYTYDYKEYIVKIAGAADQVLTVKDTSSLTVTLPAHTAENFRYEYTIDGVTYKAGTYTFEVEQLEQLFTDGKYTIGVTEVNEAEEKLVAFVGALNDAIGSEAFKLEGAPGAYTGITGAIAAEGLQGFAMGMANGGYTYIGLNNKGLLYMTEDNALEVSLQTLIDAVLSGDFSDEDLIALGENGQGELLAATMQLGNSANDLQYPALDFALSLSSVPAELTSVTDQLAQAQDFMSFNANGGELDLDLTLPEKVYELYLALLALTGEGDIADINAAVDSVAHYDYLYDNYLDFLLNGDVTINTIGNTVGQDLSAYAGVFNMLKQAEISPNAEENCYDVVMSVSAENLKKAVTEQLGVTNDTMLGMIKECKEGNSLSIGANATLNVKLSSGTEAFGCNPGYEAIVIDQSALDTANMMSAVNVLDMVPAGKLATRLNAATEAAFVMLQKDVTGNLTFKGDTVLDLNGKTITGDITANGRLIIVDSTLYGDCGGVNGALTKGAEGSISILNGSYTADVSAYLPAGYVQADGKVSNELYTMSADAAGNVTFELNADMVDMTRADMPSAKHLAVDMAADLILNYFTTAALSLDGNAIYAVDFDDLLTMFDGEDTLKTVLGMIKMEGIDALVNQILDDCLLFADMETAINGGEPIFAYDLTTAPWTLALSHNTVDDCIALGIKPGTEKTVSVSVTVGGEDENKQELADLAGALSDIVVDTTDINVDLMDELVYENGTMFIEGDADANIELDLTVDPNYAVVLGVVLGYGNSSLKSTMVQGINAYYSYGENPDLIEEAFDKVTVNQLFTALKNLSNGVDFSAMMSAIGVVIEDETAVAELEGTYHKLLVATGALLRWMNIDGGSQAMVGTKENGVYTISTQNVTRAGSASIVNYDLTVTSATLIVKLFGQHDELYTISFNANGGYGSMEDQVLRAGGKYPLPDNGFGFPYNATEFLGWSVNGQDYNVGDVIVVNGDITVYARWEYAPGWDQIPYDQSITWDRTDNPQNVQWSYKTTYGVVPTITYTGTSWNGKQTLTESETAPTYPGEYTVTFTGEDLETIEVTLWIEKYYFDLEWNADSFEYDGNQHEVSVVSGAPAGVYSNNVGTDAGDYYATYTITGYPDTDYVVSYGHGWSITSAAIEAEAESTVGYVDNLETMKTNITETIETVVKTAVVEQILSDFGDTVVTGDVSLDLATLVITKGTRVDQSVEVATFSLRRSVDPFAGIDSIEPGDVLSYTVSVTVDSDNYSGGSVEGTITIDEEMPTYTAYTGKTLTYTGEAQELISVGTVTNGTMVYSVDGITWSETVPTASAVGTHEVYCKIVGADGYKDVVFTAPLTAEITLAALTGVTVAQTGTLTYNGEAQAATVTTGATAVGGSEVTFTYSTEEDGTYTAAVPAFTAAGEHTVYFKAEAANHATVTGSFTVTVGKKPVTAIVTVADKIYDGTSAATVTVTVESGIVGSDVITITGVSGTFADASAGTDKVVTINAANAVVSGTNFDCYEIAYPATATADITPKPITVTANAVSKTYGAADPALTYTAAGLVGNDVLTGALTRAEGESAGTYAIKQGTLANPNYAITFIGANFTINPSGAYTTPTGLTATYGDTLADVELPAGFTWQDAGTTSVGGVGSNTFLVTYTPDDLVNYEVVKNITVTVVVAPAALTGVSVAQTGTLTYNGEAQAASVATGATTVDGSEVTFTYSTEEDGTYTAAVPAFTAAGEHTVYFKVEAANHKTVYGSFTVTVGSAALTGVSVAQTGTLTYNGEAQAATVTTGATTVDGSEVTFTYSTEEDGTYTAAVPGTVFGQNTFWYKAEAANHTAATGTFTVTVGKKPVTAIVTVADKTHDDSTAATVTVTIASADIVGSDVITITGVTGTFADASVGTDKVVTIDATNAVVSGTNSDRYEITYPATATGTIKEGYDRWNDASLGTTAPVSGEENTVHVSVTIGSDGAVTVEPISGAELEKVIGADVDTGVVVIDLTGLNREVDEVILPTATLNAIVAAAEQAGNDTESLRVQFPNGSVEFDDAALRAIADQAEGDAVRLVLEEVGTTRLNDAQKEAIAEEEVFAGYEVYLVCAKTNKRISDFRGGVAILTMKFDLPEGKDASGFSVWYISEEGGMSKRATGYSFDSIYWNVGHFSDYVVLYDENDVTCDGGENCPSKPYTDLDTSYWYHKYTDYVISNGLMLGVGVNQFAPYMEISRAQIVTALYRLEGTPEVTGNVSDLYTDALDDTWYSDAIVWGTNEGLVGGYGNNLFGPGDVLTREQLATLFYRYAEYKGKDVSYGEVDLSERYTDAGEGDISEWAQTGVEWAVYHKLISGTTATTLEPKGNIRRCDFATLLCNWIWGSYGD